MGVFSPENFSQKVFDSINESIEAIKYAAKIMAIDFVDREEYNAYKHGLKLIPTATKFTVANASKLDEKIEWDISDSMSFYLKTRNKDELKVVTKIFDSNRDFQMTYFCSSIIHNMIFFRRLFLKFQSDAGKFDKIPIPIFGKEPIEKCNKANVEIQNLVYSVKIGNTSKE